jgi:serine/threonine protein kinase
VAIKTVAFQSGIDDKQLHTISSEAAIASNLMHNNIVTTYAHDVCDATVDDSFENVPGVYTFYLVQEFCNGGTLRQAVNEGLFTSRRLPARWEPILNILRGVAAAMQFVHDRRICHGDLNPSNILLKVRCL